MPSDGIAGTFVAGNDGTGAAALALGACPNGVPTAMAAALPAR